MQCSGDWESIQREGGTAAGCGRAFRGKGDCRRMWENNQRKEGIAAGVDLSQVSIRASPSRAQSGVAFLLSQGGKGDFPSSRKSPSPALTTFPCAWQPGPVSLFHPLKATLEQTQPFSNAKAFLRQKSSASLNNGGAL